MASYWSYGGGVNSTAGIILTLTDKRFADLSNEMRIVFADTGAEMPETLAYVRYFDEWLQHRFGKRIEVVRSPLGGIVEYCWQYNMIPSRVFRWCTKWFKIKPIEAWVQDIGADIGFVGFDYDEEHRAMKDRNEKHRFPLIDAEMTRNDCLRLITAHGLQIPRKSGCFLCPFGSKEHFEYLQARHPDLFDLAVQLEENAARNRTRQDKKVFYLKDRPLREWIQNSKLDLWEPCIVCEIDR